jgi:uncharacterized phiE125 gp8 family phage protein
VLLSSTPGTLTRVTDAAGEALSLTDLKDQLRITEAGDNDTILLMIRAARTSVEKYINQTLIESTYKYELDSWPVAKSGLICLPMGPISSIQSVKYFDGADVQQTLNAADYEFDTVGRLRPISTKVWPATYDRLNAIEVAYTAGLAHAGKLEEDIKHAIRLMVGHYDKNRENSAAVQVLEIPLGWRFLLNPYRLHQI